MLLLIEVIMKHRYILFFIVAIFLLIMTGCSKKTSVTFSKNDFSLINEGLQVSDDYYDEYSSYNVPIKIDLESLTEYVKYFHFVLNYEENYSSLTDEEKASIITFAADLSYPQSVEYVKSVAKKYFNIDNYELPLGKYSILGSGDLSGHTWCVNLDNGYYKSSIIPMGIDTNRIIDFTSFIEENNVIILKGNYYEENNSTNPSKKCNIGSNDNSCIKGYYEYKLGRIDKSLVLDSIKYTKNKEYDSKAEVSIYGI